ncbi:MAG: hypothetical protein ABII12_06840 [Planctomycetota bacterium]
MTRTEQCGLAKFMGDAGLMDYAPLVVVMHLVAEEVRNLELSLDQSEGRKVWLEALEMIQDGEGCLEHNTFIPCRTCDQAFEPVVDEKLLTLFLTWAETYSTEDLLAIHRCPACGGQLGVKRTEKYEGDMHTPAPGSIASDEEWDEVLLQYSRL